MYLNEKASQFPAKAFIHKHPFLYPVIVILIYQFKEATALGASSSAKGLLFGLWLEANSGAFGT